MSLAWTAGAAEPCGDATTTNRLHVHLGTAEMAYRDVDPAGLASAMDAARQTMTCLAEPMRPADVAAMHRMVGIGWFAEGDEAATLRAFMATVMVLPQWELPSSLGGEGHPLRDAHELARSLVTDQRTPLSEPAEGWVLVDGQRADGLPVGRPYVFQRFDGSGTVLETLYVDVDQPVPQYLTMAAVRERMDRLDVALGADGPAARQALDDYLADYGPNTPAFDVDEFLQARAALTLYLRDHDHDHDAYRDLRAETLELGAGYVEDGHVPSDALLQRMQPLAIAVIDERVRHLARRELSGLNRQDQTSGRRVRYGDLAEDLADDLRVVRIEGFTEAMAIAEEGRLLLDHWSRGDDAMTAAIGYRVGTAWVALSTLAERTRRMRYHVDDTRRRVDHPDFQFVVVESKARAKQAFLDVVDDPGLAEFDDTRRAADALTELGGDWLLASAGLRHVWNAFDRAAILGLGMRISDGPRVGRRTWGDLSGTFQRYPLPNDARVWSLVAMVGWDFSLWDRGPVVTSVTTGLGGHVAHFVGEGTRQGTTGLVNATGVSASWWPSTSRFSVRGSVEWMPTLYVAEEDVSFEEKRAELRLDGDRIRWSLVVRVRL